MVCSIRYLSILTNTFSFIGIYKIDSEFNTLKNKLLEKKNKFPIFLKPKPPKNWNLKKFKPPSFLERIKNKNKNQNSEVKEEKTTDPEKALDIEDTFSEAEFDV